MSLPVKIQQGEQVIEVVRQHAWYLVWKLILTLLAFILWIIVLNLITGESGIFGQSWSTWAFVIGLVVALIAGLFFWYRYQNNLWVITNQRLIDSTKTSPFNQATMSTDLVNVQDVNTRIRGIAASIFKFGDVIVQTSSLSQGMTIAGVKDPDRILSVIDAARDKARRAQYQGISDAIRSTGGATGA